MCQLDVYCIKKDLSKNSCYKTINECFDLMNDTIKEMENYDLYCDKGIYCNCGSVVAYYTDLDVNVSWREFKERENEKEYDRLSAIRNIMHSEGYQEKMKEYNETKDILFEKYMKTELNYEEEEKKIISQVEGADNLSKDEWNKMLDEIVVPKIRMLKRENDKRPERIKAYNEYYGYFVKNKELSDCYMYKIDDSEDLFNINYAIKILKNKEFNRVETKYDEFYGKIEKILQEVDEIKILPFWQDDNSFKVLNKKEISFKNMKIEDIVFLKYNTLLTIKK